MICVSTLEIRSRSTLVMARAEGVEAWTLGEPMERAGEASKPSRILAEGLVAPTLTAAAGTWFAAPQGVTDEEAVILPIAIQINEAVRRAEVSLGDPLLILGGGLRADLAAMAAARRGAVPVRVDPAAPADSGSERPRAAVVLESGQGFEAAACRQVRVRGIVLLAMAGGGSKGQFDFYRNLQQTSVRMVGVPLPALPPSGRSADEAIALARAFLSQGKGPQVVAPEDWAARGVGDYLVRWKQ